MLTTVESIQQYIPVRSDFDPKDLLIYIPKANRKFIVPFAGNIYDELNVDTELDEPKKKAKKLLEESLASFAFYIGFPILAVQINSAGFNIQSTEDFRAADNFVKNDMSRTLLREGHEALDALLLIVEENKDNFSSYTDLYKAKRNEMLVPTVSDFEKYYYIHSSRQTFLALLPTMRQIEDMYLKNWICHEFLDHLKSESNPSYEEIKTALQKAMVSMTVAHVAKEGQFIFSENGIKVKFDRLPHEEGMILTNKNNRFLEETHKNQLNAGFEYLKMARRLIEKIKKPMFCSGNIIINKDQADKGSRIIYNQRILGL
jgi:hypothetical protein